MKIRHSYTEGDNFNLFFKLSKVCRQEIINTFHIDESGKVWKIISPSSEKDLSNPDRKLADSKPGNKKKNV